MSNAQFSASGEGNRLQNFMQRFGGLVLAILVILVALVVVLIVVNESRNTSLLESYRDVESFERLYNEFILFTPGTADADQKQAQIEAAANDLITKYPDGYPAQRAYLSLAFLAEFDNDLVRASDLFEKVGSIFVDSHLVEPSLFRAADLAERAGLQDRAKNLLLDLVERFPKGIVAPRALYNIGRLFAQAGDTAAARVYWEQLALEFPDSGWTNLGKDHIILLGN